MEKRTVTISFSNGDYKELQSAATTLGELKNDMRAAGISFAGMDFHEGLSGTTLNVDSQALPTNVEYRGQKTNDLVICLQAPKRRITSGSSRKSGPAIDRYTIYGYIKDNNLSEEVHARYGRHFTNVPSADLAAYYAEKMNGAGTPAPTQTPNPAAKPAQPTVNIKPVCKTGNDVCKPNVKTICGYEIDVNAPKAFEKAVGVCLAALIEFANMDNGNGMNDIVDTFYSIISGQNQPKPVQISKADLQSIRQKI